MRLMVNFNDDLDAFDGKF